MNLDSEGKKKLYVDMVRVRYLDQQLVRDVQAGKDLPFFHSQHGQEAVGVGACSFLNKDDYLLYGHRGHGIGRLLPKGVTPECILAEHYGKKSGACGGLTRFHFTDMTLGIPGVSGILGGDFVVATGMGIAAKKRGCNQVVICIQGEGTYARGTFHESMIMAARWDLPVIYIVDNNQYMGNTPISEVYKAENFADLATGYDIPGKIVDGQDVMSVYQTVQYAIDRARNGEGPSLIECKTYRIRPHAEGVPDLKNLEPRPQEEIKTWADRDPILLYGEKLLAEGVLTRDDIDRISHEAEEEIAGALKFAMADDPATPTSLENAVYAN